MNKYVPFRPLVLPFFNKVQIVWIFYIFVCGAFHATKLCRVNMFNQEITVGPVLYFLIKSGCNTAEMWRKYYLIKIVYDVPKCNVIFFSGNMILSLLSLRIGEVISEIESMAVQLPLYSLSRKRLKVVLFVRSMLAEDLIAYPAFF